MHTAQVALVQHISTLDKQHFLALCHVPKVTDQGHGRVRMTPDPTSHEFTLFPRNGEIPLFYFLIVLTRTWKIIRGCESQRKEQGQKRETHERIMLNIGCVGAAAIRPILKRVDTAGDCKGEKTRSTMKCSLIHTVSAGADGY